MTFQNGNRFAKGGKRPGAGRKPNEVKEFERAVMLSLKRCWRRSVSVKLSLLKPALFL
jgi:hypothetical protein